MLRNDGEEQYDEHGYAPFQIVVRENNFAPGLEKEGSNESEQHIPFIKVRQKY